MNLIRLPRRGQLIHPSGRPLIVLWDMDGNMFHWGQQYGDFLDRFGDAAANIPRHAQQTSFNLHLGRTPEESAIIRKVFDTPRLWAKLPPIEGAIEAYKEMEALGAHNVICSTPWLTNPTCLQDKSDDLRRHLGDDAAGRAHFTGDKTLVFGDFLLDDKDVIKGALTEPGQPGPAWQHIVYTQPYNVQRTDALRIDRWADWRDTIYPAIDALYESYAAA